MEIFFQRRVIISYLFIITSGIFSLESKFYKPLVEEDIKTITAGTDDVSKYRTGSPHPAVINLPDSINQLRKTDGDSFLVALVDYVKTTTKNQFEQVKMFHDWLALNIVYDIDAYRCRDTRADETLDLLVKGKAVCAGYSRAFKVLCDIADIPCREISGWADGIAEAGFHRWNRIKIGNNWYLVDCTWDSGEIFIHDDGAERVITKYITTYLFVKPEVIIYSHFPDNSADQLLTYAWDRNKFRNRPKYRADYFEIVKSGLVVESKIVKATEGIFTINLQVDPSYKINAYVSRQPGENIAYTGIAMITQIQNGNVTISVSAPAGPGQYKVLLFATKDNERKMTGPLSWEQPRHDLLNFTIEFE
jgi:hypothetical protein